MEISLRDTNFIHHGPIQSLSSFPGHDRFPLYFKWNRDENVWNDICFFTDTCINDVINSKSRLNIAWLLEPREINSSIYDYNFDMFDLVLTHDLKLIEEIGSKAKYFLYSGNWLREDSFKLYPKTKNISIIHSGKSITKGHRLRQEIINKFAVKYNIDVFGRSSRPLDYLLEAYQDYRFHITVENTDEGIISEKILTPMTAGCFPIYFGTDKLHDYTKNYEKIYDLDSLDMTLKHLNEEIYNNNNIYHIKENLTFASNPNNYVCENWIWENILKELI